MKTFVLMLAAVSLCHCNCTPMCDAHTTCGTSGGGDGQGGGGAGGGSVSPYTITSLDSTSSDATYLDLAVDPTQNRVGVVYLVGRGSLDDGGLNTPFYNLKYIEWKDGVVSAPEDIVPAVAPDGIRRFVGLSLAFDPTTHQPTVSYLGGGADGSLYWFNSDAEIATRSAAGTWSQEAVATNAGMAGCTDPISTSAASVVVGVWSAVRFDSTGKAWVCFRDIGSGQFPQADYEASDVQCFSGRPGGPWTGECTQPGGNMKQAWGGHLQMVMVHDEPAITYEQEPGGADVGSSDVYFQPRTASGWAAVSEAVRASNTGDGSSLAFDADAGFGIAVTDSNDILYFASKSETAAGWSSAQQVYGAGSGGLFPSLAFDPVFHEPAIAFFICSLSMGVTDLGQCPTDQREVRISQFTSGHWTKETVDTSITARRLRLGFLPNGKRVLAYRDVQTGAVKLAVQK